MRCRWLMALCRTSRAAFEDWRERDISNGRHSCRQATVMSVCRLW
jgi:hypothetical protein